MPLLLVNQCYLGDDETWYLSTLCLIDPSQETVELALSGDGEIFSFPAVVEHGQHLDLGVFVQLTATALPLSPQRLTPKPAGPFFG